MERKNEKEFYLFADNAYNEEEEPKIYAETGEEDVGSVSGADADGRAMNIFGSLSFFGVRPHKPPLLRACFMLTDRPPVGGRAAGRHSVARGSCVWRQVSRPRGAAGDITIMVLQVRRRAREIPLRFPEGSIAP